MQLAGSCSAANGVTLTYLVNGNATTSLTCPAAGVQAAVSVRPSIPSQPECSYNATAAFNVTSE